MEWQRNNLWEKEINRCLTLDGSVSTTSFLRKSWSYLRIRILPEKKEALSQASMPLGIKSLKKLKPSTEKCYTKIHSHSWFLESDKGAPSGCRRLIPFLLRGDMYKFVSSAEIGDPALHAARRVPLVRELQAFRELQPPPALRSSESCVFNIAYSPDGNFLGATTGSCLLWTKNNFLDANI